MTNKQPRNKEKSSRGKIPEENYLLVLHNDDINSFDYVINALIDVCAHAFEQAVQCTLIAHYKGSCDVRKGNFKTLEKMKCTLTSKGLTVTINSKP